MSDDGQAHEEHHGQPLWERILGTAADGVEIAATAGSHLAEEVPLLASVVHGGLGAYHAGKMWLAGRAADSIGQSASDPSLVPGVSDDGSWRGPTLDAAARKRQEAQNEGEEAQQQFFEAIPLIGTAVGLGGQIASLINPKINPAKMIWGGSAENYGVEGAPAPSGETH